VAINTGTGEEVPRTEGMENWRSVRPDPVFAGLSVSIVIDNGDRRTSRRVLH